ncbi:hypothetical protein FJU08_14940 [Martelella alba]|uniref:Outer membrane protein TolC n=1 Tax=Martelella alba TaxID=2590451 RepID=A0A506U860_9HYPH|nr:hypothetical protein [Martelella alba]TPW29145.1 hypothetical protein FJU08_14940 [Martelella alba]
MNNNRDHQWGGSGNRQQGRGRRRVGSWAALFATASLVACASPALKSTRADIQVLQQTISEAPSAEPGTELDPVQLVETARVRGQDILKARIARAGAELALDERKSRRYPRISADARSFVTYDRSGGLTASNNVILGIDWDIAYTLLGLDKHAVEIAEELIPVQYELTRRKALLALLQAYAALSEMEFSRQKAGLEADALACKADGLKAESALGNVSVAEQNSLGLQLSAARSEVTAIKAAMAIQQDKVLALAGLEGRGDKVYAGKPVYPALDFLPDPAADDGKMCFAASGNSQLEDLLVEAAGAQLDLAKKSRYTKLTAALPSFMSQTGGLSFQFLVGYVLPIIDQGDSIRLTEQARLDLLSTILTAKENRQTFLGDYQDISLKIAALQRDIAAAEPKVRAAALALESLPAAERCSGDVALAEARLERAKAVFEMSMARAAAKLLCAPLTSDQS